MKKNLPIGLAQSNIDSTLKRGLALKKKYLGQFATDKKVPVQGGTLMVDPLESVRLPKFVGGKKVPRNNIKLSL
jgi:hypothetical protein